MIRATLSVGGEHLMESEVFRANSVGRAAPLPPSPALLCYAPALLCFLLLPLCPAPAPSVCFGAAGDCGLTVGCGGQLGAVEVEPALWGGAAKLQISRRYYKHPLVNVLTRHV